MPVGARLVIAVLVAGWTVTFAMWQTEDVADGVASTTPGLWACGTIRDFDGLAYAASDIEVEGLGCHEARRFVRDAHGVCGLKGCDFNGWECAVEREEDETRTMCGLGETRRVSWRWVAADAARYIPTSVG